jgi:hypothetical protein
VLPAKRSRFPQPVATSFAQAHANFLQKNAKEISKEDFTFCHCPFDSAPFDSAQGKRWLSGAEASRSLNLLEIS